MMLDGNHVVGRRRGALSNMSMQLIEGLAADTAIAAVLEDEDGTFPRLGNSRFEGGYIGKRF